jgi:hypothetical protein
MNSSKQLCQAGYYIGRTAFLVVFSFAYSHVFAAATDDGFKVTIQPHGTKIEVGFPGTAIGKDGATVYPFYELQVSDDLKRWVPWGNRVSATPGVSDGRLRLILPKEAVAKFYRVVSMAQPAVTKLGVSGEDVYGYGDSFAKELARVGQVSPEEFAMLYPSGADYLPGISWDPTSAKYWDLFNTDIVAHNQGRTSTDPGLRFFDTRLNSAELQAFKKNGFVVSERLGSYSFADIFYRLWKDDLPVFITTDAILQAWHRTFDSMLKELEELALVNQVDRMLAGMAGQLSTTWSQFGEGPMRNSILDADFFITVARSLLAGSPLPSVLGQDARVADILQDIAQLQMKDVNLFGSCRVMDFSQFRPRGHYEGSEMLSRYFKAVMWLGRTDLPLAGGPFDRGCGVAYATLRELGGAVTLWYLLDRSGQFATWQQYDRAVQAYVGWVDSATFGQLGQLLKAAGIQSLADIPNTNVLAGFQSNILSGAIGVQNIRSDFFLSTLANGQLQLPQSFTVLGQRFTPDSWVFSQTVFDSVLWNGNAVGRRVPSALDVVFAVLGNNQVVPDLVARMTNFNARSSTNHAERFRDGFPYQHNLAAVRAVIDAQYPDAWNSTLYMEWLACLRELSAPTTDRRYPESLRTRAWAMKNVNTQLASWTQLRHNTVLYVKQSYTGGGICEYPAGYVEPNVSFWARLRQTALHAAEVIGGMDDFPPNSDGSTSSARNRQVQHLRSFADVVGQLEALAAKEMAQEPFSTEEEQFIKNLIQINFAAQGSGSVRVYSGWYPGLFYQSLANLGLGTTGFHMTAGSDMLDAIVVDVHTDVPCGDCDGEPGSVLHEGIGLVNLLMVAVDNGNDRAVYAGPVLSHFEFEVTGEPRRLTDSEWRSLRGYDWWPLPPADVPASRLEGIAPPEWTRSYLVPRP